MYNHSYQNKKRIYYFFLLLTLTATVALFLYHYFDYAFYGIKPPCGFKVLFQCYCPGCGGTRAVDAFLHGNIIQSILYHPVIVYLFMMYLSYFLPASYTFLLKRNGQLYYKFHINTLWGLLVLIVIHFVGRNILLLCFHIDYLQDFISY